jgi:cardiolipin synthase
MSFDLPPLVRVIAWSLLIFAALQLLVVAILLRVGQRRKKRVPDAGFPVLEDAALTVVEVSGNRLRPYMRGGPLYEDMLTTIRGAEREILFESYIWKDDEVGQAFKEALEAKARAGVAVFVSYDTLANLVVPRSFFRFAEAVHVLAYRAWSRPRDVVLPTRWGRNHRKILVVDRQVAFVGGYNIGATYRDSWRDTHLRIDGPGARDLAFVFADFWNARSDPRQPAIAPPKRPWAPQLRVHRNDRQRLMFPIRSVYVEAIEHAQQRIELTSAYFVPDASLLAALQRAARRGVDVRVLVPLESNQIVADWLSRTMYEDVLGSGVRIFRYAGAMIHAKTCTIDGVWSTIGTANMDRLSLAGNHEVNVEIFDEDFAADMSRIFDCDLGNAEELSQKAWRARPWIARVGEAIIWPLRPLV